MLQTTLNDVVTYGPGVISVLLMVIGAASVAAAHLPKSNSDAAGWWAMIRAVLDYVAQNYKNAKNAEEPQK